MYFFPFYFAVYLYELDISKKKKVLEKSEKASIMFFLCQIFLRKCKKMKKKKTPNNIIDGLFFPFFLNNLIYFLFNMQLLVRVEFILAIFYFEAVLPEGGVVGLTGFKWV